MIKIKDIYNYLDSISPFDTQESWDNSGLLIGNMDNEVENIFTSLEATKEVALRCTKNSLLITHHPLIFKALKTIDNTNYPSNIIDILIKNNITLISTHTNFDISHLNKSFIEDVLGFKESARNNFVSIIKYDGDIDTLCKYISLKLPNTTIKLSKAKDTIKNIGIVCGAGISLFYDIKDIDCIITGDVKYHDAIMFLQKDISVIDVGHYESEKHFPHLLGKYLKNIGYNATTIESRNPFIFKVGEHNE